MAHQQQRPPPPSRVWLLSIPRSGSHLLTKIFSKQSRLSYSGYNFMEYIFQHHKVMDQNLTLDQLSPKDREALLKAAKNGLAQTKSAVEKIEVEVSTHDVFPSTAEPHLQTIPPNAITPKPTLGQNSIHKGTHLLHNRPLPDPPTHPGLTVQPPLESPPIVTKRPKPNPPTRRLSLDLQTRPPDPPPSSSLPVSLPRHSSNNAGNQPREQRALERVLFHLDETGV